MRAKITTNGITKLIECSDEQFINILLEYNDEIETAEVLDDEQEMLQYAKEQMNDFEENFEEQLEETKASRFNQHLDNTDKSFANISAERNAQFDNEQDKKAFNNKRTKRLENLLNNWNLKGYIKTRGGFDELGQPRINPGNKESEENSFFIPNITKEQAVKLGKLFNQDSIFFKEENSNKVEEIATNKNYSDENKINIGDKTGLVFIVGQGRYNINKDKTYYSRPKNSSVKFAYNPDDNLRKGRGSFKNLK